MISEAPTDISSEIRSTASDGMATRSSASAAVEGLPTDASCAPAPLPGDLTHSFGTVTTSQRTLSSSLTSSAVNTWVPSGRSGCANVTGELKMGSKPLRTNSLPSLRLMKTEIGPGRSARKSETVLPAAGADLARRARDRSKLSYVDRTTSDDVAGSRERAMASSAESPDLSPDFEPGLAVSRLRPVVVSAL